MTDVATGLREVPAAEWDTLLERLGLDDAYLRRGYVEAAASQDPGRPVLLHVTAAGGDVVCALVERDIPGAPGERDLVSPYGYGGPAGAGAAPPYREFVEAFRAWATDRRAVTCFWRFHPLLANHVHAPAGVAVTPLVGVTAWDLGGDRDLEAAMHARHRRSVRKARAAGVVVEVVESPADLDGFVGMYEHTMRRQQAASSYFFPKSYWDVFTGALRDAVVLVQGRLDGEPVAGLLCMATPPYFHYHLGASTDAARDVAANVLCFLEAAQWARARGMVRFGLGGGVGGQADSLFDFKRRFDPERGALEAYVGRQVLDPVRYRELSGTDSIDGFFPAYRA